MGGSSADFDASSDIGALALGTVLLANDITTSSLQPSNTVPKARRWTVARPISLRLWLRFPAPTLGPEHGCSSPRARREHPTGCRPDNCKSGGLNPRARKRPPWRVLPRNQAQPRSHTPHASRRSSRTSSGRRIARPDAGKCQASSQDSHEVEGKGGGKTRRERDRLSELGVGRGSAMRHEKPESAIPWMNPTPMRMSQRPPVSDTRPFRIFEADSECVIHKSRRRPRDPSVSSAPTGDGPGGQGPCRCARR